MLPLYSNEQFGEYAENSDVIEFEGLVSIDKCNTADFSTCKWGLEQYLIFLQTYRFRSFDPSDDFICQSSF